ncbi:MAG: triose-phosphate isomerase [Aquificaceae bacterium]|nr:triose-phosphate isomerase [Aquificaceae bacterium]MDW8237635.1 triose-phosphate isomerase [Aquificaceae bacterium]
MKLKFANFKMNMTASGLRSYLSAILPEIKEYEKQVAFFTPCVNLFVFRDFEGEFGIGAQNFYFEEKGAFTGEVSLSMLKELNVSLALVGHSERRQIFGESNELIGKKLSAALKAGIEPVLCIGESLEERQAGVAFEVIKSQLRLALGNVDKLKSLIIAYEPIWAIGSGNPASPEDAEKMHGFIKETVKSILESSELSVKVLYGGSVNLENAGEFLKMPNVDGLLVGGASLDPAKFAKIVKADC